MDILQILFAIAGGIFGAALGSLTAFIFTGITGLIGIALLCAGVNFDFMALVPFGVFFGPHISFAGGAAAAAYARKRGYLESGKDIVKPLMSLKKPDVLIVGGLMGLLGYIVNLGVSTVLPGQIDSVGMTVFIVAIISKVIFGDLGLKEIFGQADTETKSLALKRYSPKSKNNWIEYMSQGYEKWIIAIAAGGLSGYITYVMLQNEATASASIYVGFIISVISLLFLQQGLPIPVTHHITLIAAYAVLMSGSWIWGIAGAVMAAFVGDFMARTFFVYGDTHVDPPAMSIGICSFLVLGVFGWINIYEMGDIFAYIILGVFFVIAIVGYLLAKNSKASDKKVIA